MSLFLASIKKKSHGCANGQRRCGGQRTALWRIPKVFQASFILAVIVSFFNVIPLICSIFLLFSPSFLHMFTLQCLHIIFLVVAISVLLY
ncbi:hypothetical protein Y032_0175g503 [Ancylostoma ceylanicum]|uniref:G-protein coupled receptors family 1 profile domain-containing protein n=1 Tax=Ancylostoma ceylanicum TaxID=53326 RepID=A0A016SUD6_9BILA|nr:hypothetical protein Y032_0175g503 [Ancylostoma ceylanicum]